MLPFEKFLNAVLRLVLILSSHGCGVVIVGNPHGTGKGSTPSGQIRILKANIPTQKFTSVLFNITGIKLLSDEGDHHVQFDSAKNINWLEQNGILLEGAVPARRYQGLSLSFDRNQPAMIEKAGGRAVQISNGNRLNSLDFRQTFSVAPAATKNVLVYLNVDRALQKNTGNSGPSTNDDIYQFSPYGVLMRPDIVRSITGKYINSYGKNARLCLYRVNEGTQEFAPDLDQANAGTFGNSAKGSKTEKVTNMRLSAGGSSKFFIEDRNQPAPFLSLTENDLDPNIKANPSRADEDESNQQKQIDKVAPLPTIDNGQNPKEDTDCKFAMIVQDIQGESYRLDNLWPGQYVIKAADENGMAMLPITLGDNDLDNVDL